MPLVAAATPLSLAAASGLRQPSSTAALSPPVSTADFERLAASAAEEDGLREALIKRSRDVGKLAKQAIYSLHRRDLDRARGQLSAARAAAVADLLPSVERHPALRFGAVAAALEEYAEGAIFMAFLERGVVPELRELEFLT